ncbi:Phosphoglucomutase, chloroplastic [Tetrabaena socialis]|uniref:Phosphoglucomutase, chloroplastic n=1 Tax=Tetrabaena socialis TaxID=47790 RepID=A0A2J8A9G8_9CHLO|nr:Phosphoglucomutase, chloroplastic [Tetrabaena socialis]|eukprot:PNH09151.1 Phosphoglucomutase, chloroplastic [Tetrabaena socialis]
MRLTQHAPSTRGSAQNRVAQRVGAAVVPRRVARVHVSATMAAVAGVKVNHVPTTPYEGQKTGTSGLRKKTKEFMQPNYLANWVQSLFSALGDEAKGKALGLGGDGRYYGKEAAQIIIKLAAGNGFKKVYVGQDALMATPAASALIRRRHLYGESGWALLAAGEGAP